MGLLSLIRDWRTRSPDELATQLRKHEGSVLDALTILDRSKWEGLKERIAPVGTVDARIGELLVCEAISGTVNVKLPVITGAVLGRLFGVVRLPGPGTVRLHPVPSKSLPNAGAINGGAVPVNLTTNGARLYIATSRGWFLVAEHSFIPPAADPSNDLPKPIATSPSAGSSERYARADHEHTGPTTLPYSFWTNNTSLNGPPNSQTFLGPNGILARQGDDPIASMSVLGYEVVARSSWDAPLTPIHIDNDSVLARGDGVSTADNLHSLTINRGHVLGTPAGGGLRSCAPEDLDLATRTWVTESLDGLASETYVDDAVSGLASEQYVDDAVDGLASEQYVDDAVDGLATTTYVDSAVEGLASEAYVDDAVSGLASDLDSRAAIGPNAAGGLLAVWGSSTFIDGAKNIAAFDTAAGVSLRLKAPTSLNARLDFITPTSVLKTSLGYDDDAGKSHITTATDAPGEFRGEWSVPSGSTLSVPAPSSDGHAATKKYVDDAVDGLASETYVDSAVDGLASETYVDNAIAADIDGSKIKVRSLFTDRLLRAGNLVTDNRVLELSDLGCTLINVSAAPRTLTVPADAFPDGAFFRVYQFDEDNRFTIAADSGVTLVGATERATYRPGDYITLTKLPAALFGNIWLVEANCSESGTYTPTVHSTINYSATSTNGWWIRVGNIVHMGITILGRTVGTGPNRQVLISLPIARSGNFPNNNVVGGSANYGTRTTNNVFPAQIGTEGGTQLIRLNASDPSADDSSRTWSASLYYSLD